MKKAQILSAIALAFALGVVAPVAATYAEEGTDTTTATTKATAAEVDAVIESIEAQPEYQAYVALKNAMATTVTDADATAAQAELATAIQTATGTAYSGDPTLDATIEAAKGGDYDKWVELASLMNSDTATADEIKTAATALGITVTETDLEKVKAEVEADTDYTNYKALIAAVEAAEEKQTANSTAIADLKNALAGVGVAAADIDGATTIADLKALEPKDAKATSYADLINAVEDAKNANKDDEAANAELIADLKTAYKDASGTDLVVTEPSAPDSGAVAAANGDAAATISVVAGLATALTALGAGVVAYRSARRSNK